MTKKSSRGEFNSFVKGLVTEASVLNFPEQAASDIDNFELNKDGSLNRRPGFGFETDFSYIDTSLSQDQLDEGLLSSYVWSDPAGQPGEKYLVLQADSSVKFYNLNSNIISLDGYLGSVTLTSVNRKLNKSSYATVDGKLVIATGDSSLFLVEYNISTESFSISNFKLKTRDIWGVSNPSTDADSVLRPTSSSVNHSYNLYNQGWGSERRLSSGYGDAAFTTVWAGLSKFPSDSDTVWSGVITLSSGSTPQETFTLDAFRENTGTTSSTSRGYFIIDLLDRGVSRSSAVAANYIKYPTMQFTSFSAPSDYTSQGATVVGEYAGRICYAGFGPTTNGDVRSPDLSAYVAFSRLIRNRDDFGKCYQEGDPTSRDSSDLVDTDGGLIRIAGCSTIRKLIPQGANLIVCADNGVWAIQGGSDYGFNATNYRVDQISDFGIISPDSAVTDGSRAYYWSSDGIYSIYKSELGDLTGQNISDSSIGTFYKNISTVDKRKSIGVYDKVSKNLRWIYPEDGAIKELVFSIDLGAYYVNTVVNLQGTNIVSLFNSSPFTVEDTSDQVLAGSNEVLAGADSVFISTQAISNSLQTVKYLSTVLISDSINLAIGWYRESTFSDWKDVDSVGIDAKAYLKTGALTAGDSSIHKQAPLLVVHMERTEDSLNAEYELNNQSSCLVRTEWDFATSAISNKFSPLFQVYRYRRHFIPASIGAFDNGFDIVTTRNKLRGRGRALSLYMETEPTKDCKLIGWNLSLNGNTVS